MANHYVGCITLDITRYVLEMDLSNAEKRKLISNITHWGSQFDAPGVHSQLLDGLVDCGFMHLFPLREHPNYMQYQAIFDNATKTQVIFLFEQPDQKWAGKDNPVDCYWIGKLDGREEPVNMLCCQPDCKLWPVLTGLEEPERMDTFPLFLELAGLADKAGNDSLKGALYHAVTVELGDELEGNFDEQWLPVIERLKELLFHDAVMERAKEDFGSYEEYIVEYDDEEYGEQAPTLCGWTKYYCNWLHRQRDKRLPGYTLPQCMELLEQTFRDWQAYLESYPQDVSARHDFARQLAEVSGVNTAQLAQTHMLTLVNMLGQHQQDAVIQRYSMTALVNAFEGLPEYALMEMQHPNIRAVTTSYPDNLEVQVEYARCLYLMAKQARAENRDDLVQKHMEEIGSLLVRHPGNAEITAWLALCVGIEHQPDSPATTVAKTEDREAPLSPELEQILEEFRQATLQPAVTLRLAKRETTIYSSKVGGAPYLPPGFDYPTRNGKPLWLLAQLNFEELPHLPVFPETGMLQFYIAATNHYGADFDDLTRQDGFRVVYHEQIERDPSRLQSPPEMTATDSLMLPFAGEFALEAELTEIPMSYMDFRFDPAFLEIYRRHIPTQATRVWDLLGYEVCSELEDRLPGEGHRMGGYPCFTQQDPRLDDPRYRDYTVLLLQLDTEGTGMEYEICWGDAGVGNFFITPQQLEQRDFSRVLYTWDCG